MNAKQRWKNRATAADLAQKVHRCARCGASGPNHYTPRRQITLEDVIRGTVDECGVWWCAEGTGLGSLVRDTSAQVNKLYQKLEANNGYVLHPDSLGMLKDGAVGRHRGPLCGLKRIFVNER